MFLWLLVSTIGGMSYPVLRMSLNETQVDFIQQLIGENETDEANSTESSSLTPQNLIDPSIFITLRKYDWRDDHKEKMIIWSLESQHHPEFGKVYAKGMHTKSSLRHIRSSQIMSFMILGSVIGFILYTYLSHVLLMRKLDREEKAKQLRALLRRSAVIMAGSAQQSHLTAGIGERRRSLINMFSHFKL